MGWGFSPRDPRLTWNERVIFNDGASVEDMTRRWSSSIPVGRCSCSTGGIDVGAKVGHIMHEAFGAGWRAGRVQKLAGAPLGRRQEGFYLYGDERAPSGRQDVYELTRSSRRNRPARGDRERCVLQMVNEARTAWAKHPACRATARGAIFGSAGRFPAGRSGMRITLEAGKVVERLRLPDASARLAPARLWSGAAAEVLRMRPSAGARLRRLGSAACGGPIAGGAGSLPHHRQPVQG